MNARDYALMLLDSRELPGWRSILRNRRPVPPVDPRDLALAEQIAIGVIKNLLHIRFLLEHYSGRRLKSIDPLVQKILAVGLYQLRFLDRIPSHAAVNESVEQARRMNRGRAAGFVNAVLRKVAARDWPGMPDVSADPAAHAEIALSCPRGLFAELTGTLGVAGALEQCRHANAEPPTIVRVNPGRRLDEIGLPARPHSQAEMFVVESPSHAKLAELADLGIGQVQDPTAAQVASLLSLTPGQRVLDRCAGVGTKTIQLSNAVGVAGMVVAMDPSKPRCDTLRRLAARRGLSQIQVVQAGKVAELPTTAPEMYDAILVDVPCSNSGVLARRPEARFHQTRRHIESLIRLQDAILRDTAPRLKPGGRLVYSTCSIWPAENHERVLSLIADRPDYRIMEELETLPHGSDNPIRYRDGGYRALLIRQ